jgi:hypothetical protein
MKTILGFPTADAALIASVGALLLLCTFFPVIYSAQLAFRAKPALPRRFLFVCVVTALCYGCLLFFLLAVSLPLQLYSSFVAPQLEFSGYPHGRWLIATQFFISDWGWVVFPLFLGLAAVATTRYLASRWPAIVAALGPNKSFKPNPLRGSA